MALDHIPGSDLYQQPVRLKVFKICEVCGLEHTTSEGPAIWDPRMRILFFNCRCGGTMAVRHFHTEEIPLTKEFVSAIKSS